MRWGRDNEEAPYLYATGFLLEALRHKSKARLRAD